jgi:hypothetical protein
LVKIPATVPALLIWNPTVLAANRSEQTSLRGASKDATVKVLEDLKLKVRLLRSAFCCGQAPFNEGLRDGALDLARRFLAGCEPPRRSSSRANCEESSARRAPVAIGTIWCGAAA